MDVLTVKELAHALHEPQTSALAAVLHMLGPERTAAVLNATQCVEAQGGMQTNDGTRRRTPGGVFFHLAWQHATPAERQQFRARRTAQQQQWQKGPALTSTALHTLVTTLPQGDAHVTVMLSGRPDLQAIQTRPTYVAFRMQGAEPGSLPSGLPPVPGQAPIVWLVVVAMPQWQKVQGSLEAHADDVLRIEGHPIMASDGTHVLLTLSCASKRQQREQRHAHAQAAAGA
jgi:PHAX RNA-binding domain